jgi:hypothetical protein
VPSSIAWNVACPVLRTAGSGLHRAFTGCQAMHRRGRFATRLQLQRLLKSRDAEASRATVRSVVRFYTTVPSLRERAMGAWPVSTPTTKEQRSRMKYRRADSVLVRRCLSGHQLGRAWSPMRGTVPRGGSIRPSRGTAPPFATHRGVAGGLSGAVFCQEGVLASPRPFSSDWRARPAKSGRSRRCQD